jgi:CheY-like chemotaxis protein
MAGASGSTILRLDEDRLSASPSRPPEIEDQPDSAEAATGRLHVLMVEDNGTDVFVIKRVLEECGLDHHVRVAGDGQEALLYLRNLAEDPSSPGPALVLLDLNVPKITGIEVLQRLRNSPRCGSTPVIVVTSSVSEQDRLAVESLGAAAYFQKPNDLSAYMQLAQVIKRILCR